ncbi:hypothetical protein [Ensifer soli]|uniref:hypothetical protein n=1 Tax=Ciceribacter sp. sgz301302 TaxID=3342379 RepID=UPI0035BAA33D
MTKRTPIPPIVAAWFKAIEDLREIEDRLDLMGYTDQTLYLLAARDALERHPPEEYRKMIGPDTTLAAPPLNLLAELIHHAVASIHIPPSLQAEFLATELKPAKH